MKPENFKQMFEITTAIHQNDIDVLGSRILW